MIVLAIAFETPGLRTDVVARGVPVGVAVMNVSAVPSVAVSVTITPVALTGTPPTPATWTVIDESGPTGAGRRHADRLTGIQNAGGIDRDDRRLRRGSGG